MRRYTHNYPYKDIWERVSLENTDIPFVPTPLVLLYNFIKYWKETNEALDNEVSNTK